MNRNIYSAFDQKISNRNFTRAFFLLGMFVLLHNHNSLCAQTIDLSKPVGSTKGSIGVSPTGSSTYSIPIDVLSGTNGMEPNITLNYNSSLGDINFGQGWSLSCLSSISRDGKSNYYNGINTSVSYTNNDDAFVLDGQRLFVTSGTNGANGAVYGAENENFDKVESFGGTNTTGPDWFRVTTKTGLIMEYGHADDAVVKADNSSSSKMLWLLNRITDINGNYQAFHYFVNYNDRNYQITEIDYTGNEAKGIAVYNRVVFSYTVKSYWQTQMKYSGGASLATPYLLNTIDVMNSSNARVKRYQCNYTTRHSQYLLSSFKEIGADGVTSLNPLTFTYGSNMTAADVSVTPITQQSFSPNTTLVGDLTGDGKQDLVVGYYKYDNNNFPYFTNYIVYNNFYVSDGVTKETWTEDVKIQPTTGQTQIKSASNYYNFLSFDYDGDSKQDVLRINWTTSGADKLYAGVIIDYSRVYSSSSALNNVSQSYPSSIYLSGYGNFMYAYRNGSIYGTNFIPGDFDGDGTQDYILLLGTNSTKNFKAFFSSPKKGVLNKEIRTFGVGGSMSPSDPYYAVTIASANDVMPVDFDGDGKTEILVQKDDMSYVLSLDIPNLYANVICQTTEIKTGYPVYPGDFNGDGNTDLLVRQSKNNWGGAWRILYSNGKQYNGYDFKFAKTPVLEHDNALSANLITVADFNGDGKCDIWHSYDISTSASQHTIYYSNGVPTPGSNSLSAFFIESYAASSSINKTNTSNLPIGDFNGDGKMDLFSFKAYQSRNVGQFIYAKPDKEDRLMTSATDGLGGISKFTYSISTNHPDIYQRSSTYSFDVQGTAIGQGQNGNPYMVINSPMYVVANSYIPTSNSGSWTSKTYRYQDAAVSSKRGFLGFKQVSVTDDATSVVETSYSEIDASLLIPHVVRQTVSDGGITVSDTKITDLLTRVAPAVAADKRYKYQITKVLTTDGLTGSTTENNNTYDSYNNVVDNVINKGYLSGTTLNTVEKVRTTTTYGTHGTPVPSAPESVSVASTRTGQSTVSKQTSYTYDTKGNILTIKDWDGTPVVTTTTNVYDGFGNVISKTVSGTGIATPSLTYTYDILGRFLTKKQATGSGITKTETFSYDPTWGLLASSTSSDGLTTSYSYDGNFGTLTKTTQPDGNAISQSFSWESSSNARYSVSTQRVADGGEASKKYYDILGRVVKTETGGFNNQTLTAITTYNTQGQIATQTDPYYSGEPVVTTTTSYDVYGRVMKVTNGTSSLSSSYSQLSNGQSQVAVTNAAGQLSSKTMDAAGKVVSTKDNGGQLNFTYNSWGNQLMVQIGSTTLMSSVYDSYGRQTTLTDKNAGAVSYEYDVLGRINKQTDALNQVHTTAYDAFGRVTSQTGPEGTTNYTYWKDANTGKCNDNVATVTGFSGDQTTNTYDNLGRLTSQLVAVGDGTSLTKTMAYDTYGNLITTTYPSGVIINDTYDKNGALIKTTMGSGSTPTTLFTATSINSKGIYTAYSYGNGKSSSVTYDLAKGAPSRYYTAGIQDLNLNFDAQTGNLLSRNDAISNLTETFTFDNLNRLTSAKVGTITQFSITYDNNGTTSLGNIKTKSDVGNYIYDNNKINAVKFITSTAGGTTPPGVISQNQQDITYTPFLKASTISENGYLLTYTYGQDQQRIKSVLKQNGTVIETKYYLGAFERQTKAGVTRDIHYINAGNGLCAIVVKQGSTTTPYFVYSDHLGSLLTLTNASGAIIAQQNFDAWGRNRNPVNWTYTSVPSVPDWLYRGFTGHEHLTQFALINMNGRMYDPANGRMLSPDDYVPMPMSTQGYNRYGYCNNNPLIYIDPDGNFMNLIIGGFIGGTFNLLSHAISGKVHNLGQASEYFGVGALAGALGTGISDGISSSMAGGKFGAGFLGTTGASATGFYAGAASGAAAGFTSGLTLGIGNGLIEGKSFMKSLSSGLSNGLVDGMIGGIVNGIKKGIDAIKHNTDFFSGKTVVDLSQGYGADNLSADLRNSKISMQYVGQFEGVNVYESSSLGYGRNSAGITLPGYGITVGKGTYTQMGTYNTWNLLAHEFGHILQSREEYVGLNGFYKVIAPESLASATLYPAGHRYYWTETWANFLSHKYFSGYSWNSGKFPIQDISVFNLAKFLVVRPNL